MTMKDVVDAIGEPCWHRAYVERLIPQLLTPARDAEANAVRMRGASGQLRGAMARIDELEREASARSADVVEVDLEGRRDRKDPGIRYLGKAIRQSNGEYYVLADVYGSLCRVAVTFDASSTVDSPSKVVPLENVSSVDESLPVATDEPGTAGKRAIVDVAAIVESCRRIINSRPVVISADVLLSVACLLLDLQYAVRDKREAIALTLSNRGPSIGGPAVADAVGGVVESVQDWIRLRRVQILADLSRVVGPGGGVLTKKGRAELEGLVKVYETGPLGLRDAIVGGLYALDESRYLASEHRSVLEEHCGSWFGPAGHVSDLLASIDRVATGRPVTSGKVDVPIPRSGPADERYPGSVVVDGENIRKWIGKEFRAVLDDYEARLHYSTIPECRMRSCAIEAGLRELDGGNSVDSEVWIVLCSLANRQVIDGRGDIPVAVSALFTALDNGVKRS